MAALRALPVLTLRGKGLVLAEVAEFQVTDGPPMLCSENARFAGLVYVDIRGRDFRSAVREMQYTVADNLKLPTGCVISWSGQFDYLERAGDRLNMFVPLMLLIIFVPLFLTFRSFGEALLNMATAPLVLVDGVWLLWTLGHSPLVASARGFIALVGVAAESGVIMILYLKQTWTRRLAEGRNSHDDLLAAIREGAVFRVRPYAMTVTTIVVGLLPLFCGNGAGSGVMQRIAAPMFIHMLSAPLLSLFMIPTACRPLCRPAKLSRGEQACLQRCSSPRR